MEPFDITREIVGEGVGRSEEDRILLTRRYARLTSYLTESWVIVLLAAINHTEAQRAYARDNHPKDQFGLVWIKAPLEVCQDRDPKGLYRRAKEIMEEGDTPNVVGVDIEFEELADKDVVIATDELSPEDACAALLEHLLKTGALVPAAGN